MTLSTATSLLLLPLIPVMLATQSGRSACPTTAMDWLALAGLVTRTRISYLLLRQWQV
jgi:hypothetical protein